MSTTAPTKRNRWRGLALWLGAAFSAAAVGVLLQGPDVAETYAGFSKPGWAPPPGVFGPVWTVLYAMMGVAAWRVWAKEGFAGAGRALALFLVQLAVNAVWSPVFFGLKLPAAGLAVIGVLLVLVAVTLREFFRHEAVAGWLLVPYLAWVAFATALNAAIVF